MRIDASKVAEGFLGRWKMKSQCLKIYFHITDYFTRLYVQPKYLEIYITCQILFVCLFWGVGLGFLFDLAA